MTLFAPTERVTQQEESHHERSRQEEDVNNLSMHAWDDADGRALDQSRVKKAYEIVGGVHRKIGTFVEAERGMCQK